MRKVTISQERTSRIVSIKVEPDPPSLGEEVKFKVNVRSPRGARIRSYSWDFDGDNRFETSSSRGKTVHTFDKPGVHLVRVRVWAGKAGCGVEATRRVTVRE